VGTDQAADYYEILQISSNAEPETVHRVYRLLAQRFHPDNSETGNDARFRELTEAYDVIADPARRAQYDVTYSRHRQERWRLVTTGATARSRKIPRSRRSISNRSRARRANISSSPSGI